MSFGSPVSFPSEQCGSLLLPLLLIFCFSWIVIPGDVPIGFGRFDIDFGFFWDSWYRRVAPGGALMDAGRLMEDAWGSWVG